MRLYAAGLAVLFLFGSAGAVRATEAYTPSVLTAREVLLKAAQVRGHLEPGSYTEVLHIKRGAEATVRTIVYSGNDYRATSTTGSFSTSDGAYRDKAWRQDQSGIVTIDSGFHDTEDPNARALAHPDDPAGLTLLGVTVALPHRYAIDIHPSDGNHEIRYYDATTFYLVRDETDGKDQNHEVETYDDFRTAFGSTRAYHYTDTDGHAENDYERFTASFVKSPAIELTVPASRSLFSFSNAQPVVVPMVPAGRDIVIAAKIGDRTLNFALDSGAASSSIDPAVADSLGLKQGATHSTTVGGNYKFSHVMIPRMTVSGLPMTGVYMATITIPKTLGAANIVGLLGHDVLASAIVRIDVADQTVTFYPREAPPVLKAADAIPIELDDYVPRVAGTLDGQAGHFMIDTGAGVTLLFNSFALKDTALTYSKREGAVMFIGGTVSSKIAFPDKFSIGSTTVANFHALVPQSSLAERDQYDGIIGRDVLNAYVLYFDYANSRMFIRPPGE